MKKFLSYLIFAIAGVSLIADVLVAKQSPGQHPPSRNIRQKVNKAGINRQKPNIKISSELVTSQSQESQTAAPHRIPPSRRPIPSSHYSRISRTEEDSEWQSEESSEYQPPSSSPQRPSQLRINDDDVEHRTPSASHQAHQPPNPKYGYENGQHSYPPHSPPPLYYLHYHKKDLGLVPRVILIAVALPLGFCFSLALLLTFVNIGRSYTSRHLMPLLSPNITSNGTFYHGPWGGFYPGRTSLTVLQQQQQQQSSSNNNNNNNNNDAASVVAAIGSNAPFIVINSTGRAGLNEQLVFRKPLRLLDLLQQGH